MQSSTSNIPILNPEADESSEVILALPIRERVWNKFAEFHLVLHFEQCSPCFTLNCELIFFGELHGTFPI
jgi:hypothetical protein